MRKLATIKKISDVFEIQNSDNIECVKIDGWNVVTKKNTFETNDLCVFFEIDSVIPVTEQFEFLRKGCYVKRDWLPKGEGFRLKTIRLRGQVSQGLALPVVEFGFSDRAEGEDVTDELGIIKWDPPIPAQLAGKARGNFPSFIRKTDQERIQNMKADLFDRQEYFEATIKLDGSSMTVYVKDGNIGVCSRNLDLDLSQEGNSFIDTARRVNLIDALKVYHEKTGRNIAFQGELMGPGIQGNRESLAKTEFFLFDIFDIDNQTYVNDNERAIIRLALSEISEFVGGTSIKSVPYIGYYKMHDFGTVEEVLKFADGHSLNNPVREGVVFKSTTNPNYSFKAISNQYLLTEE